MIKVNTPIKVAMVIQGYYPLLGGAERQLEALIPFLQSLNVEVHVLTRRYDGLASFDLIDGVPVYRLPIPGPKPIAALSFVLSALPIIKKIKPHVIHAHEMLSPTTTAIVIKQLFDIPIVVKVLRGGVLGDLAKLKRKPFGRQRIASSKRWVDTFIAISREIDDELEQVGVSREQRAFIPNGVDMERFTPLSHSSKKILRAELGMPTEGTITLYTGRLSPEKRINNLVSLWPTVRVSHPDAQLLILGEGSEETRLKNMAGDGVIFLGLVDDVAPYLKVSDLFVLPSTTEGLSNALLEALAAGLPAIATAVGGAPDVIEHKVTGWLVPSENVNELQLAILTLLGDSALCRDLGTKGREKILQSYSLSTIASHLLDLYLQCIN